MMFGKLIYLCVCSLVLLHLTCSAEVLTLRMTTNSEDGSVQRYTINTTWDSQSPEDNAEIHLTFSKTLVPTGKRNRASSVGLLIEIDAPFYKDPVVPSNIPVGSTDQLWNYEVVEVFFLSESEKMYLETEFAPSGHYLLLQLDDKQNVLKYELPLNNYTARIDHDTGRWQGEAIIPLEYLPSNVNKFNAYAIHRSDPNRVYMSLFPVPKDKYPGPNFHRLNYFGSIDLSEIIE